MKTWSIIVTVVMTSALILSCTPSAPRLPAVQAPTSQTEPPPNPMIPAPSKSYLTPNPVETEKPNYGGTLSQTIAGLRSLDAHQLVGYGPTATLPVFNQLVMFDINYKDTVPETIIGDLADSWETSQNGTEITFKLHQGVKWHDGVPFSADDVVFSLDKMTDPNRSVISSWFPAYESTDKIDENTVTVHLKYASAGFMLALAQGESQIQPYHLSGTDGQSAAFAVGTGPFILTEYVPGVDLKYKRNPDYWKKDKNGDQLPYLDGINIYIMGTTATDDNLIARRLDIRSTAGGALAESFNKIKEVAPEVLWQRKDKYNGLPIFINTKKPPLDDIRVRRAMGLVLNEEDLIIGFSGDVMWGTPNTGILHPAWGLPKDEVVKLMGWDVPYEDRVAEAQNLMADAGHTDGFKLTMLSTAPSGATLVLADALRTKLKITADVVVIGTIELFKRVKENDYDTITWDLTVTDPIGFGNYFATNGNANYSKYSNPDLDKILEGIDHVLDPDQRREVLWSIDRILLTDLPALPTGLFRPNMMAYYPWVKNMRWTYIPYSNINRLEDVWIDESLKGK